MRRINVAAEHGDGSGFPFNIGGGFGFAVDVRHNHYIFEIFVAGMPDPNRLVEENLFGA